MSAGATECRGCVRQTSHVLGKHEGRVQGVLSSWGPLSCRMEVVGRLVEECMKLS
jgi:hypothetical protein